MLDDATTRAADQAITTRRRRRCDAHRQVLPAGLCRCNYCSERRLRLERYPPFVRRRRVKNEIATAVHDQHVKHSEQRARERKHTSRRAEAHEQEAYIDGRAHDDSSVVDRKISVIAPLSAACI